MCVKVKWVEKCMRGLRMYSASANFSETMVRKQSVMRISDDHAVMNLHQSLRQDGRRTAAD
jgi:hypothetical protein